MKIKHLFPYLILGILLLFLGLLYFKIPYLRIYSSLAIGLVYFLWGIITHLKDKTLHWPVIFEYLGISLLAVIILIFLSLRA